MPGSFRHRVRASRRSWRWSSARCRRCRRGGSNCRARLAADETRTAHQSAVSARSGTRLAHRRRDRAGGGPHRRRRTSDSQPVEPRAGRSRVPCRRRAEGRVPTAAEPISTGLTASGRTSWRSIGSTSRSCAGGRLPGVEGVALAAQHPLDAGFTNSFRWSAGKRRPRLARDCAAPSQPRLLPDDAGAARRGPSLHRRRYGATGLVRLVNEAAAARFFPGRTPVGQQIASGGLRSSSWGSSATSASMASPKRRHRPPMRRWRRRRHLRGVAGPLRRTRSRWRTPSVRRSRKKMRRSPSSASNRCAPRSTSRWAAAAS